MEAAALAGSSGHHHEHIATAHRRVDRPQLERPQRSVAKAGAIRERELGRPPCRKPRSKAAAAASSSSFTASSASGRLGSASAAGSSRGMRLWWHSTANASSRPFAGGGADDRHDFIRPRRRRLESETRGGARHGRHHATTLRGWADEATSGPQLALGGECLATRRLARRAHAATAARRSTTSVGGGGHSRPVGLRFPQTSPGEGCARHTPRHPSSPHSASAAAPRSPLCATRLAADVGSFLAASCRIGSQGRSSTSGGRRGTRSRGREAAMRRRRVARRIAARVDSWRRERVVVAPIEASSCACGRGACARLQANSRSF